MDDKKVEKATVDPNVTPSVDELPEDTDTIESRIAELPEDLEYQRGWYNALQAYGWDMSGTFQGHKYELHQGAASGILSGSVDGEKIAGEDVHSFWDDISPVVIEWDRRKKEIQEADRAEKRAAAEAEAEVAKAAKLAEKAERAKLGEPRMAEVKGLLDENIGKIELGDSDREFVDRIRDQIADLSVIEYTGDKDYPEGEKPVGQIPEVPKIRRVDSEGNATPQEKVDEYTRKRELLLQLLGADKEQGQKWEAGFGVTYLDSIVYDTVLPDMVLRESFDTEYQRFGAGSQLYVERNSRYQRQPQAAA